MIDNRILEEIKCVSLPIILGECGIKPASSKDPYSGRIKFLYFASYRDERHPSLSVYMTPSGKWHWTDHATGEHGTSLDLLVRFGFFPDWRQAAGFIARRHLGIELDTLSSIPEKHPPMVKNKENTAYPGMILKLRPIEGSNATRYITDVRHIPIDIAMPYLHYAQYCYEADGKVFFGMAWPTIKGGWAIRWAMDLGHGKGKTFVGPAGVSYYQIHRDMKTESCTVFEGMFDFLSFIALNHGRIPCDAIVMNSTSYINQAIEILKGYVSIHCYFDNDEAGMHATNDIWKAFGNAVVDHSPEYSNYNDLNDYFKSLTTNNLC